jgi:hypothetical protein
MSNLVLWLPHHGGVTWRGLCSFLVADHEARRHREDCGCLIANVELYGHDQTTCTNIGNNPPKDR